MRTAGLEPVVPAWAAGEVYDVGSVKAAFLYRFTGYVDWPEASMRNGAFTIAVLGSEPVATELGRFLPSYSVKGLPAGVRAIRSIGELGDAQMLYVGEEYQGSIRAIVEALGSRSVLLVTDRDRALDDGSVVNFRLADRRVRFEISLDAAQRAGLKIGRPSWPSPRACREDPRS